MNEKFQKQELQNQTQKIQCKIYLDRFDEDAEDAETESCGSSG